MKYLFDTDHISISQRQAGSEYATLLMRVAQHPPTDLACSIISFHKQILGCHTYISQARRAEDVVRGYGMLAQVLRDFTEALVIPFDAAAPVVCEGLVAQRVRVGTMDLRIAAIALSREMVLVTRNVSDFRKVPGLRIEDWTM
ncbi:MAG TPA: type II toxin-antitoxin system VapC family toxin [Alphaproteobacteria bacterium]|nr:type II toxin-antitoxin system VapC family toxin [Alphaproteobacteria bacterium]